MGITAVVHLQKVVTRINVTGTELGGHQDIDTRSEPFEIISGVVLGIPPGPV